MTKEMNCTAHHILYVTYRPLLSSPCRHCRSIVLALSDMVYSVCVTCCVEFTLCLDCLPLLLCGLNVLVVVDHLVNI